MKKFFCLTGLIAAVLLIFVYNIGAEQPAPDASKQASKTLILQASWKPGVSDKSQSFGPQWQMIQFGDDFVPTEPEGSDEIVTPKSAECLFCHGGSFAELAKTTVDYVDEWGDPVNPHTYVDENKANPHQADKVVPDCLKCHKEHDLPQPTTPMAPVKLSYCFSCHHQETFEVCSDCH
ncbi:MAG: cytochrome c3 family protein [Treponema sp.]|nr:cytochrome c3 family protein [Treponema sp.]